MLVFSVTLISIGVGFSIISPAHSKMKTEETFAILFNITIHVYLTESAVVSQVSVFHVSFTSRKQ